MEPKLLKETLLFFNHRPCYYKLYQKFDMIIGEPSPHHFYTKTSFPYFIARMQKGSWIVEGVHDHYLADQVVKELVRLHIEEAVSI